MQFMRHIGSAHCSSVVLERLSLRCFGRHRCLEVLVILAGLLGRQCPPFHRRFVTVVVVVITPPTSTQLSMQLRVPALETPLSEQAPSAKRESPTRSYITNTLTSVVLERTAASSSLSPFLGVNVRDEANGKQCRRSW